VGSKLPFHETGVICDISSREWWNKETYLICYWLERGTCHYQHWKEDTPWMKKDNPIGMHGD
jgi:hypothetical protein